jgi:hypothetical protein
VRGSWLGAALVAAPAAGVLSLAPLSVDVPYIDDYDALLGFLRLADETPSLGGKLRLLVEPHNEHRMLVPRLGALAVLALRGHLDFAWLNGLGTLLLLAFLGALWLGFRRGEPAAEKWLAFAPAALFLVHPQYWMVYHSPTTSLSGFTVAAAAGLAFAALDAGGGRRTLAALALAALATATLASGWLVAPLGVAVPLARRRWKAALVWGLLAAGLLAAAVALLGPPASRADPLAALAASGRLAAYTLNFVGCAAGFSQPGLSLTAGALLLAGLAAAALRGLPRKSPVLFALVLFFLASAAANALGRAQQGAGTPLLQSRYRFYSAALLALCWLSWAELLRDRRRVLAGALAAAAAFSAASFALYRGEVPELAGRLARGFERWWQSGDGGLLHPEFRTANALALYALDRGWLHIPPHWLERFAAWPIPRDPPAADRAVELRFDVLAQQPRAVVVSGSARAGSARGQEVEIVLRGRARTLVFPTRAVPRVDATSTAELAGRAPPSGFRALLPLEAVPPGRYQVGALVRRGGREHLSYLARPFEVGKVRAGGLSPGRGRAGTRRAAGFRAASSAGRSGRRRGRAAGRCGCCGTARGCARTSRTPGSPRRSA